MSKLFLFLVVVFVVVKKKNEEFQTFEYFFLVFVVSFML